jgi:hypothetical protein
MEDTDNNFFSWVLNESISNDIRVYRVDGRMMIEREISGTRIGRGNQKYSEKTRPSATFSTTNPTWPDLESK